MNEVGFSKEYANLQLRYGVLKERVATNAVLKDIDFTVPAGKPSGLSHGVSRPLHCF